MPDKIFYQCDKKLLRLIVENTALGYPDTAPLPVFAPFVIGLPGFCITFVAIFKPTEAFSFFENCF